VIRKEVPSTPAQKKAGGSKTATTTTAAAAATHKGKGKGKETPPAMTFHMECLQCGKVVQQPDTGTSNLTAHMRSRQVPSRGLQPGLEPAHCLR
jgi:hypothetical protein